MLGRIWTISTILSFSRIILLAPVGYLLLVDGPNHRLWAACLMIVAGVTDFLDGYLARLLHQVTEFGKIIDPVADKIAAGGSAVFLVVLGLLPLWYVVVIVVRDLLILLGGLYIHSRKKIITQSNWPGKFAVTFVAFVLILSVLEEPSLAWSREVCLWTSLAMMALSTVLYSRRLFIGAGIFKKGSV